MTSICMCQDVRPEKVNDGLRCGTRGNKCMTSICMCQEVGPEKVNVVKMLDQKK